MKILNMNKNLRKSRITNAIGIIGIFFQLIPLFLIAQDQNIKITIHLRGVYESNIKLLPLSGTKMLKSIVEVEGIKIGETTLLSVPKDQLPGEFVLRFDYKEKMESLIAKVTKLMEPIIIVFMGSTVAGLMLSTVPWKVWPG